MAGYMTTNTQHLIRSALWSRQLKQLLLDDLMGLRYVKPITEFPDGELINIPSLGEADTKDYAEGMAVRYDRMDTGNFQFSWDQYKYSAHSITEKFKQDSFYASDVLATFAPRQHRAIMEAVETDILASGPAGQTSGNVNTINGAHHRYVATGTGERLTLADVAKAWYSLKKANVPMTNLVAIVDPSTAHTLMTQANVVNLLSPMPKWGELVNKGLVTGMQFQFSLYGFDFYVSNYLPRGLTDSIDAGGGALAAGDGVANLFFSAAPGDTLPIIGGFKQTPTVYSEFNKDLQQEEYLTITRYGFKLYRPENLVTIITDTDVV